MRAGSQTITNDGEYDLLTAALACDPVDLDLVHAVLASRSTELQELDGHYDISSVNRDYIIRHSAVEAARRAIDAGSRQFVQGLETYQSCVRAIMGGETAGPNLFI